MNKSDAEIAFIAGWRYGKTESKDVLNVFEEWFAAGKPKHGCTCSECGNQWETNEYPSPCPKCGTVWH